MPLLPCAAALQLVTWKGLPLCSITTVSVHVCMVFAHPAGYLVDMDLREMLTDDLHKAARLADNLMLRAGQSAPYHEGAQV
jgi:hypothetical protein